MVNFIVEDSLNFTDRMRRCRVPTTQHTPEITSFVVEQPTRDGPYGAKGVGEIAGIPTAPAITNAIFNAVGVRVDTLPAEPETIWRAMEKMKDTGSAVL